MANVPIGTATCLFTDIEGSTLLLRHLGERYADLLAEYRRLLGDAAHDLGGEGLDTEGDACFIAFPRARDALAAAVSAQLAIRRAPWPEGVSVKVRMGLHTGEAFRAAAGYVGIDFHRAERICSAAHGGQILMSHAASLLVDQDLPAGVSLRDVGAHRLKDLQRPERLFQVVHADLPTEFPALRSLDLLPHNLPIQLTSFVGRTREIRKVRDLMAAARLVTLTGIGGCGKTRLALQVAADSLEEFADGGWLVELATLFDDALVAKAVASALGVPEQPGRALSEMLVDRLRPRSLLLLFDNCEHLLVATAQLADTLLQACPRLRILATSREPLGVPGEVVWRVPSLSVPDPTQPSGAEDLMQYESVRLFIDRAALGEPGFRVTRHNAAAVVQATHRLDGIPLAIELAAARVKNLAMDVIASRLDDRFRLLTGGSRTALPRHQTLRATLDWSYDLLSEHEQMLLRRLSVFMGGFPMEAAEEVCGGEGVDQADVLDLVTRLVDKSLVLYDEPGGRPRYRLLETVRQYSLGRLEATGETATVQRRHRDWFWRFAEGADRQLRGPEQEIWLERFEAEHDNLRGALEWSRRAQDAAEAELRLAGALYWFWFTRGHWAEGRRWLERALERGDEASPRALPKVFHAATNFAWRRGDYDLARELGEKGLALSRELEDTENCAWLLHHLGIVARRQGDYERARALAGEGLALSRELGDKHLIGVQLSQLGLVARYQGDFDRATSLNAESLALFREAGDKWSIAYALRNIGCVALHQGDCEQAEPSFCESLVLCGLVGDRWITEECLEGLAEVAALVGEHERAARLFGAAEVLREFLDFHPAAPDQALHDRCVASTRAAIGDAALTGAWAAGRAMTRHHAVEYALRREH